MRKFSIRQIKFTYYILSVIFIAFIITTPYLIKDGYFNYRGETLESVVMFLIIGIYVVVDYIYQKILGEYQNELAENNKYIGQLNVKMENMDKLFYSDIKIPQTQKEYKETLIFFADTILGLVNVPVVHVRIIGKTDKRTVGELTKNRYKSEGEIIKCGNNELLDGKRNKKLIFIESKIKNDNICVFCVLPKQEISGSEKTMVQAAVNILALVLVSYKENNK